MKISIIKLSFGIIPLVTALMFSFSVNAAGNEQALNNVKA